MIWDEWFYYDETSPSCLRWALDRKNLPKGQWASIEAHQIAGSIDVKGYYTVRFMGKLVKVHRIVFEIITRQNLGDRQIDHRNRIRSDNVITNLKATDPTGNARNHKRKTSNKTGATGVVLRDNRYIATWNNLQQKQETKSFNINKYGKEAALKLAIDYRNNKIAELNLMGAGYTEDHGK